MSIRATLFITSLVLFATGCGLDAPPDHDSQEPAVVQSEDVVAQDDFTFRLVSKQAQYKQGEEVQLYGEIEYTGDQEEITISHSSSAILFPMTEETTGYEIGYAVNDIGLSTTLKRGEPYREQFQKSGGYSADQDPDDYVQFIKNFLDRDDFPAGSYVVRAFTDFSVNSKNEAAAQKRFNLEAAIRFEVVD